jgi:hypothetical protein
MNHIDRSRSQIGPADLNDRYPVLPAYFGNDFVGPNNSAPREIGVAPLQIDWLAARAAAAHPISNPTPLVDELAVTQLTY